MMNIYTWKVIAPAHWAVALIYGDFSGIESDEECERIETFLDELRPGTVTADVSEREFMPPHLTDTPDELAGDYCEYTVIKAVKD